MMPGKSKKDLVATLDHFGVNRVRYYNLQGKFYKNFDADHLLGLRSTTNTGAKFYHGVNIAEVLELIINGEINPVDYIACDSLKLQDEISLVCNGEMLIKNRGRGYDGSPQYNYSGFLNFKRGVSCRDAGFDDGIKHIRCPRDVPRIIFDEMWSKGIIDYVVEFSLYREPVGIKNERLMIWGIRSY